MHASARIVASLDPATGVTRLPTLRSEVPLVLRQTPEGVYLVGGAAGPLGGDLLALDITVGDGATLLLRSAAALLAQPGRHGGESQQRTTLRVGHDGRLDVRPEPLVSVVGSEHRIDTEIELDGSAELSVLEELVLGRHAEASGRVRSRTRIRRGGSPLLTHELDVGGDATGWASAAVLGGARAIVQQVLVAPDAPASAVVHRDIIGGCAAAWLPLAPGAAVLLALGPSLLSARQAAAMVGGISASRSGAPSR